MKFKPHTYQEYAKEFIIAHPECAIFQDMGLGKTVTTLTAINELIYDYFEVSKVLIIAPLRVARDTWPDEIKKWDHLKNLRYSVIVGDVKTRLQALNADADLYIINRENVHWLEANCPKALKFDMVVLDELSSFKNYAAQRSKALRRLKAKWATTRMVGLTGTPAPNGLMDLFGEIGILDGGKHLGKFITHFRDRFFNHFNQFSYTLKQGADTEIYDLIDDMTVSMKAVDYLDMPELIMTNTYVEMTKQEQKTYKEFMQEYVLELSDGTIIDAPSAASLSSKLSQLSNGFIYDSDKNVHRIHSHKLDALRDIIEEAQGQNLMVAYWFNEDRDILLKEIPGARLLKSSQDMTDWNEGKIKVGLIHPASAGHGLNLQAGGHIIVWYGLAWSLELYEQLNARLYRQGQKSSSVVVRHIVTKNSYDAKILKALGNKDMTQSALMNAVKAEIGG